MMIKKCVSGFQSGADIGGIIAAHDCGLETGGTMPKGFLTENGPRPEYAELYGAKEHSSDKYPPRTFLNCKESDATVRFASDFNSSGEKCTMKAINQYKKIYFDININSPRPVDEFVKWLFDNNIETLNVAGNRESTSPGIGKFVEKYLKEAIEKIYAPKKRID